MSDKTKLREKAEQLGYQFLEMPDYDYFGPFKTWHLYAPDGHDISPFPDEGAADWQDLLAALPDEIRDDAE